jgi:cysteine desulfurase
MSQPIYLDYQSTTPVDSRVIDVVMKSMTNNYGNPHSNSHQFGWEAKELTEIARENIANLIGANSKEVIFTSGATESNNIAIRGVAEFLHPKKNHIITVSTEHKCVINTCRFLEQRGFDVTFLSVGQDGLINLDDLKNAITDKTCLVSIMAVNNEIGVIQPIEEIGKITRERGVLFHTDAAQAFGKIPLDVEKMNIDLMSISGHKIYAPKGVGALYIRRKPRVRLVPLIQGGGQERGWRSGTLPMPLCVGLGEAAKIAKEEMQKDAEHAKKYFDRFYKEFVENTDEVYLNGSKESRYYGNINLSFRFIEGESMIMAINKLAVSSGSACTSSSLEPSYVMKSLGVNEEMAHTSIRFGFGRFTTDEEIDFAVDLIRSKINGLRELSPLWEMYQEGIDISEIKWANGHG